MTCRFCISVQSLFHTSTERSHANHGRTSTGAFSGSLKLRIFTSIFETRENVVYRVYFLLFGKTFFVFLNVCIFVIK